METKEILFVKTGVFTLNRVQNIWDEILYGDSIDITVIDMEKQFYEDIRDRYNETHDNPLPDDYDWDADELELVDWYEKDQYMDNGCGRDCYLIGYKEDPNDPGYYIEDENAEYSCYIGEDSGFVVRSKWICLAPPGSPCIPHQVCLDDEISPKTEWAYTLPPEVWGEDLPEGMEIIETDKKTVNLTVILLKGRC